MKREIVFQLQSDGVHMIYRTDTFSGAMPLTGFILNQPKLLTEMLKDTIRDSALNTIMASIQKVAKALE